MAVIFIWLCALTYGLGGALTAAFAPGNGRVALSGAIACVVLVLLGVGLRKRMRTAHVISLAATLLLAGGAVAYLLDPLARPMLDGEAGHVESVVRGVVLVWAALALVVLLAPSTFRQLWRR